MLKIKKQAASKKLPLTEPIIHVYPHHANLNAIFLTSDYELPMVFNNYIPLVYDKEIERADFLAGYDIEAHIMSYPLCMNHAVSRELAEHCGKNIIEFMETCIEEDYYIHCLVDTYYIHAYEETCGVSHFMHNILLYGYDGQNRIFYAADCFMEGKYSFAKIPYEEFERGFTISGFDWLEGIRLIKKREAPHIGIWYDIPHLKEQINYYIKGSYVPSPVYAERKLMPEDLRYAYGIHVYDEAAAYIHLIYEEQRNFDARILYVLYDHAKLMAYMSKQLCLRGQLGHADEIHRLFSRLGDLLYELTISVIKFNMKSTDKAAKSLFQQLMEAKELDRHAMELFGMYMQEKGECVYPYGKQQAADSLSVCKTGIWKHKSGREGVLYSRKQGDSLMCVFYGTELSVYGYSHAKGGNLKLTIDKTITMQADTASKEESQTELCKCSQIPEGYHTAELENISEEGKFLMISGFESNMGHSFENHAEFLGLDKGTSGKWDKKYGKAGYDIVGYGKKLPEYIADTGYLVRDGVYVILVRKNAGDRGLRYGDKKEYNIAAYYLQKDEFILEMTIAGEHETEFYCADYDNLGRSFALFLEDGDTGKVFDKQVIEDCRGGVYLRYQIKGHIKARFQCLQGPDVTVSGIFWE